jgi:hypothetical protein
MPTIAWFYGIAIRMYVRDHPPPHFQAVYAEYEANVLIETGEVIDGARCRKLPHASSRSGRWCTSSNCARIGVAPALVSNPRGSQVSMLTKVTRLDKLGGFKLRVHFSDGSEGVHDFTAMTNETGSMLEPLRDEAYFSRVFLEFGALILGPTASTSRPSGFAARWRRQAS